MKINNQTYKLDTNNYFKKHCSKRQIVIGSTYSSNMNHFNGWKTRHGGEFKRTAAFTIDIYGNIHQHYPPEFFSNFLEVQGHDEHIIPILIENEGWLVKDSNGIFTNYVGNEYIRQDEVLDISWRGKEYWAPFKMEQADSLIKLLVYLCDIFNIELNIIEHNTKIDDIYEYTGIVYKSNFNKQYLDLSPAWYYDKINNKLKDIKTDGKH